MNLNNSQTYQNSLALAAGSMDVSPLYGKRVLITGSTGLICSAIVDILLWHNKNRSANIQVLAATLTMEDAQRRFAPLGEADGLFPVLYDATKPISFGFDADFIIHGASNATPDAYVKYPVDTMLSNILGIHQLLTFAKDHGVQKTVYISSSEVYGSAKRTAAIKEDEYGFTDILNVRSSYPMGKKAAETMCVSFAGQYGTPVSIVRPGHIYGPTASPFDKRISSDFAYKAARGEDLVMKSAGTQMRSYCHTLDCASAILTVLMHGASGDAYNISNPDSLITIREMANLLAKAGGVQLLTEDATALEKAAFNPMDYSSLNSEKLEALGWKGCFGAEDGLANTVQALKEII